MTAERTFTKSQIDELLAPLLNLVAMNNRDVPVSAVTTFRVPLSRSTSVEVKFHGPVGIEEYDALLAHVAFYKLMVPQEGEEKLDGRRIVEQLRAVLNEAGFDPKARD